MSDANQSDDVSDPFKRSKHIAVMVLVNPTLAPVQESV